MTTATGMIAATIANPAAAAAKTRLQTGFELRYCTLGELAGQNGWAVNGFGAVVQSGAAHSGLQAIAIAAEGLSGQTRAGRNVSYAAAGSPEPIVRLAVNFQVSATGNLSAWTALSAVGSSAVPEPSPFRLLALALRFRTRTARRGDRA